MAETRYDLILEDGLLLFEGYISVQSGLPNGQGSSYDNDGNLIYKGNFVDGEYEGLGKEFYANGNLKYQGEWLDDQYHGQGSSYDQNGKLIYQGQFNAGKAINEKPEAAPAKSNGRKIPAKATGSQKTAAKHAEQKKNLERLVNELHTLVGIPGVKKEITTLMNMLKVQKIRSSRGLPSVKVNYHMVLTGNPGTGKTTVARLIGKMFGLMGMISKGHLVEVERSALIGGFQGQTAIKVAEVVEQAVGGVLFIDEAYNLVTSDNDSYGHEAVSTLLKLMEDHRDDLVVIIAGYRVNIDEFLQTNPGLESRFNQFFHFEDYNAKELAAITRKIAENGAYCIADDAMEFLERIYAAILGKSIANFSNARFCRNFYEKALNHHSNRVAALDNPSDDDLTILQHIDFRQVVLNKELRIGG